MQEDMNYSGYCMRFLKIGIKVEAFPYVSDGFCLVKWRVVLGRTAVFQKHHTSAVKRGRNNPRRR